MSYLNYLTKPLPIITTSTFSFLGNRNYRSLSLEKDPKKSLANDVINLFANTFLRSKEQQQLAELSFYMRDAVAIGIGTVTPLLISGFLKASPRKADGIHFIGSYLISVATTAYLQYREDNNHKK